MSNPTYISETMPIPFTCRPQPISETKPMHVVCIYIYMIYKSVKHYIFIAAAHIRIHTNFVMSD